MTGIEVGYIIVGFVVMVMFVVLAGMIGSLMSKLDRVLHELDVANKRIMGIRHDTDFIGFRVNRIDDYVCELQAEEELDEDDEEETEEDSDEREEEEVVEEYIVEIEDITDDEDELDIHLITPEQFWFSNGYSKNELRYYPNADQVRYYFTDNTYLCMEDIPEYIGDGLVFFGMNVKEPNIVYVRNHVLNADFRIEKVKEE